MTKRKGEFCSSVTYSLPISLIERFNEYMAKPAVRKSKVKKSTIISGLLDEFLQEGSLQALLKKSRLNSKEQDHGTGESGGDSEIDIVLPATGGSGAGEGSESHDAPVQKELGKHDDIFPVGLQ